MSTTLNKITTRAKLLRRKNPKMKYIDAVKKASIELRKEGTIGKVKKVVTTKKKKKVYLVGKRKPVKKRVAAVKYTKRNETRKTPAKKVYRVIRKKNGIFNKMQKVSGISKKDQKEGFEKVQRFHKYAHLMSDNYNKGTTAGSNAGFEYQRKCYNLLYEIEKHRLDNYAKKIFDAANAHYRYFKK